MKKFIFALLNLALFGGIFLGGFYWYWSKVADRTKAGVEVFLKDFRYKDLHVTGFPVNKEVVITGLEAGTNRDYLSHETLVFDDIRISSFIFGNDFNVMLGKEIKVKDEFGDENGKLLYNEQPTIKFSFYTNGSLKDFDYKDIGYRVLDKTGKTLYVTGPSDLKLISIKLSGREDYNISANMLDIQNFSVMRTDIDKDFVNAEAAKQKPLKNHLIIDVTYSKEFLDNNQSRDSIEIKDFLLENEKYRISMLGEVKRVSSSQFPFGQLLVKIDNLTEFVKPIIPSLETSVNEKYKNVAYLPALTGKARDQQKNNTMNAIKNLGQNLNDIAKLNSDTTDKRSVFLILKVPNNQGGYYINQKPLEDVIKMLQKYPS
jgi:hypothetical protein